MRALFIFLISCVVIILFIFISLFIYFQVELKRFKSIKFGELIAYCAPNVELYKSYVEILNTRYIFNPFRYLEYKNVVDSIKSSCIIPEVLNYIEKINPNSIDNIVDFLTVNGQYGKALWVSSFVCMKELRVPYTTIFVCNKLVKENNIMNIGEYDEMYKTAIYNTFVAVYNMVHSNNKSDFSDLFYNYMKDAVSGGILGVTKQKNALHNKEKIDKILGTNIEVYGLDVETDGHNYTKRFYPKEETDIVEFLQDLREGKFYSEIEFFVCRFYDDGFKIDNPKTGDAINLIENDLFLDIAYDSLTHFYLKEDPTIGHSNIYPELCDALYNALPIDFYKDPLKLIDCRADYIEYKNKTIEEDGRETQDFDVI